MRSLHRKIQMPDSSGVPIPNSLTSLSENEVEIRRGELTVIYATAGMGKSTVALNIAISSGVPTLYVSSDTNSLSQAVRALSIMTARTNNDMREAVETHRDWCVQQLRGAGHVKWVFDSSPTIDDLLEEIQAFTELFGEPPHLMVVDNATDVVIEGMGDEWGTLRELFRTLKTVGRENEIAMLALHHASDQESKYSKDQPTCPPRWAMQGKVSQVPALILSMASTIGWAALCPVKNREGWSDPSGNTPLMFEWAPERSFIADGDGRL